MRICIISKYPPIEGGVSARVYWLAKALGGRGHEIHIVTNAQEVENEYKERINNNDREYTPQNVYVHSTELNTNPWHIPFSKAYTERIANLAIEIIEKHDIQLIDSYYILPYGIAAFLAKNITGRPQILHHAGSDIGKLFTSSSYNTLFKAIFQRVDKIITISPLKKMFLSFGIPESKIAFDEKVSVDTRAFNAEASPFPLSDYVEREIPEWPIITYIGKINYHWKNKGLYELVEAVKEIKDDFLLLFVANGRGLREFQNLVREKNLEKRSIFLGFVPPWKIPSIIKLSTCVVVPEREFPIQYHTPILPREVMSVGKCLLLSRELYDKGCCRNLVDGESVLLIDPKDIRQFRGTMKRVIRDPSTTRKIGQEARKLSEKIEIFDEYIDYAIGLYTSPTGVS
ncbi:MAG: glycosyltransferase [Candidatus Helarchaeota archaeon]|nr:glycosyltransferase [Candidatus Helarchaeota archaeon]